jgi:L-threonylcarbamoyladenylate synthase
MVAQVVPDGEAGRADAVRALRGGGIVALPTDTVYGIGVDLRSADGIERLFAAKERPLDRGIVLLLADVAQAASLAEWPPAAAALADAFWPGGLTLVVPQRPDAALPPVLTGGAATIGLRVPNHECPRALAEALGPLPVTSANLSGRPEAGDAEAILEMLGDRIELIVDGGPSRGGPASTVVQCTATETRILRPGAIPLDVIAAALRAANLARPIG